MARIVFCDGCGAPLDAPWKEIVIVCSYCGADNLPGRPGDAVPSSSPADGRPRLNLDGRTYVIEGKLADGDSCSVYRARWVRRLGELVVIKVLHASADADLLRRERAYLLRLSESRSRGSDHFRTLLPRPIALGPVTTKRHGERLCAVYQWQPGFVHTLVDVGLAFPNGIDGRIATWIAKRLLELLAWVHANGVVHGAVIPNHVLIHPRDHGALLIGWGVASALTRSGPEPLLAISRRARSFYPDAVLADRQLAPRVDIQMACSCAIAAWGLGASGPALQVLKQGEAGEFDDAWALREALDTAGREQFGPPAYNPLPMPGWG